MPYVQRDAGGAIVGRFLNKQPGYAEEWLADDAPEILAIVLADKKQDKIAAAAVQYEAQLAAGVVYGGHNFQIDEASQQRIAAMGSLAVAVLAGTPGAAWPPDFVFIAADNTQVAMTAQQMFELAQAAVARVLALRVAFRNLKDAILAAPDQAALDAIDVAAGWPD